MEQQPVAEEKGGILDSLKGALGFGKPDVNELKKKYEDANANAKDANAKAKEAADALAAAEAKTSIPTNTTTNTNTNTDAMTVPQGGRRRSRKQAGGRRRRTRRGKRSGCKRCGFKQCVCSKKRRTRR